ncbi:type II toxin-antitoxin system Phd/YefM family antitoxin [Neisseria chenwenguii]|uniref:Antitoxin n=1 Tax=Neisseria chenwenguii TaxID=1853278 RepID=A0A220S3C4_9NEIS|nr:type II toxin-antitoxin system prevent-host-death family antitoxin [Neisseria chenwenguii]ASK27833.1 type II toxin-antitoxin system prevent-host-death family antitoxin [Neisseria chenwenguii]ROV56625.1 type II toxin-antitoxin system prevent-host-death family antitoxin [Neisseria chenwenguii]
MFAVHASDFRKNLAAMLDRVADNAEPVLITRSGGAAAVLLDINEYNALTKTAYLLSNPVNAARLAKGIAEVEVGNTAVRELDK